VNVTYQRSASRIVRRQRRAIRKLKQLEDMDTSSPGRSVAHVTFLINR
jgi:hypothetical protein